MYTRSLSGDCVVSSKRENEQLWTFTASENASSQHDMASRGYSARRGLPLERVFTRFTKNKEGPHKRRLRSHEKKMVGGGR